MEKEVMVLFSMVVVVAVLGMVFVEAGVLDGGDIDDITGQKSWRKKFKKAFKKVEAEAKRASQRVEAEVKRTDDNLKKAAEKVGAEAGRFGNRVEAEWKRFDNRVSAELERSSEKVEAQFKRTNDMIEAEVKRAAERAEKEVNRIDDNLKKMIDSAKEHAKKEFDRLLNRIKSEVDTQRAVFKGLAKGRVCDAYRAAQKSDAYNVNQLIYDTLMPPIKNAVRPPIQSIVTSLEPAIQSALAAINAIPLFGQVVYGIVAPAITGYMHGPMVDDLSENAAKKAIREALEECN